MPKKAKEWSPVDRMLANKGGMKAKSASPKPPRAQSLSADLPPLSQALAPNRAEAPLPPRSSLTSPGVAAASQTTPQWSTLMADATASERQRTGVLQEKLRAAREQLQSLQIQVQEAHGCAEEEATARARAEAELAVVQNAEAAAQAAHHAERRDWQAECAALRRKAAAAAADAEAAGRQECDEIERELREARRECADLRKQLAAAQTSVGDLSGERDLLLVRLETEQAEMIARVDALQKRFGSQ